MIKTLFQGKGLAVGILLLLITPSIVSIGRGMRENIYFYSSMNIPDTNTLNETILVPDSVEIGDLILIDLTADQSNLWKRPGPYNEHSALYIGNNTFVEANGVVRYRDYTSFYLLQRNLVFLRVKTANESQRHAAAAWAISKIGVTYQYFFESPWFGLKIAHTDLLFPTANELYCMELLWAAYYAQGIDIDQNGWKFPWWVDGNDILHDDDIEVIYQEVNDSIEITKPYKGLYITNKRITYPILFTIVVGNIDIEVSTLNEMVTWVDFYINGTYLGTDVTEPYGWTWNERCFGKKSITAVAYDDAGNQYKASIAVWKFF
jgi:hypothetical protein